MTEIISCVTHCSKVDEVLEEENDCIQKIKRIEEEKGAINKTD